MNENDEVPELETIKIRKLIKKNKFRIIRFIFCIISTMGILFTITVLNRVFTYIFVRWNSDMVSIDASVPFSVVITVFVWNYVVGMVIAGLLWKYIGLPRVSVIGKLYKSYMDMYHEE